MSGFSSEIDTTTGPPFGLKKDTVEDWFKRLLESASVLGEPERHAALPFSELLSQEDRIAAALRHLRRMNQLIVLTPPHGSDEIAHTIDRYSEPQGQEPFMHDRADNRISVLEFCGMVISGYEVELVDQQTGGRIHSNSTLP